MSYALIEAWQIPGTRRRENVNAAVTAVTHATATPMAVPVIGRQLWGLSLFQQRIGDDGQRKCRVPKYEQPSRTIHPSPISSSDVCTRKRKCLQKRN